MSDSGRDELDDGIEREEPPDSSGAVGEALQPGLLDDPATQAAEDDDSGGADIPIITMDADAPPDDARDEPPPPSFEFPELGPASTDQDPPSQTIIAIGSGRGGVGKSLLAANIAVYLAQIGKRIVAVDGDPAGGTLNHLLGTSRPARGLGSFLRGRSASLDDLAVETPVAGVRLVAGESLPFGSPRPKVASKAVLRALRALDADVVVVDLGPPDGPLSLDLWTTADTPILVTLADPASIEASYRFLKSAFLRRVRGERGFDKLFAQLGRPLPAPLDLFRAALETGRVTREDDSPSPGDAGAQLRLAGTKGPGKPASRTPAMASALATAMAKFRPRFVVSQTRSLADTKLGPQMSLAAHRRLGHSFDYLGHLESDETVAAAARRNRPVMAEFPEARICKNIERIVRRILSTETERPGTAVAPRLEEEQTFYEILETEPGVSDEEIRRAFRSCKEIYATGSPVVSGLYDDTELAAFHERANAAHDTLFSPEKRRHYDLSLPEADLARAVRRAAHAPRLDGAPVPRAAEAAAVSQAPPIDTSGEITGSLLRRIRESRGMELSELAQRTKISERHLRSIEDERFDELPAPVYVRGFVIQMARLLRVDSTRVAEGYLRRFHGANGPSQGTPLLKEI